MAFNKSPPVSGKVKGKGKENIYEYLRDHTTKEEGDEKLLAVIQGKL